MEGKDELSTWRTAALVMIILAAFVFVLQRFVVQFFSDVIFEICIFYVPAVASAVFYLYLRRKL